MGSLRQKLIFCRDVSNYVLVDKRDKFCDLGFTYAKYPDFFDDIEAGAIGSCGDVVVLRLSITRKAYQKLKDQKRDK